MTAEIKPWPKAGGELQPLPKPMMYPAEHGLIAKVADLESQLGTVEAYNGLVAAAEHLRAKIEQGRAQPQQPHAIGWAKPGSRRWIKP